ncbi:MAG: hypothetical protein A2033_03480 [Bacteroidetes bacterium GWA2_31_9]|nr:MAG: hypothetical protein A2033_03480 [Bacteroidetes bacterium GWA2_31_9]
MQYILEVNESNQNKEVNALIKYLRSLNIVTRIDEIEQVNSEIPNEIKEDIRKRYEVSLQNPENRVSWDLAKKNLYEQLQNISQQKS